MTTFTQALARVPAANAAAGETTSGLGPPDIETMRAQHREYVRVMESLGVDTTVLESDERFPDSCFVEDTAIVTPRIAVVARPGASSRRGEEASVRPWLASHRPVEDITAPGTVDGGDILVVGERALIGISARTNEAGAGQLAEILESAGIACTSIAAGAALHLKSSINMLGEDRLLVTPEFEGAPELAGFETIVVPADETYAGNSLWVNDHVLVPAGFPGTRRRLEDAGIPTIPIDVSEFRKMDGGLTCLSIRL